MGNPFTASAVIVAVLIVAVLLPTSLRIANEYERAVVFRLGRFVATRGPGLYFLIPMIERQVTIDLRVVTADVEDRVLAIGKHVPVRSAMGESVGIELFSAASSRRLFAALHHRVSDLGLVNEYYEAAFQQIIDEGTTLYGVDIGSMYATEIDTIDDLLAANARLAARPAFDVRIDAVRLAV